MKTLQLRNETIKERILTDEIITVKGSKITCVIKWDGGYPSIVFVRGLKTKKVFYEKLDRFWMEVNKSVKRFNRENK